MESPEWIYIPQTLLEWKWFNVPEMGHLWITLLLQANYEDQKWQGVTIKRGQLVIELRKFANEIGLSVRKLRTCLNRLKAENKITSETINKHTIVTICNYEIYLNGDSAVALQ